MIYTADFLVTQNENRDVIEKAAIAVDGARISEIGTAEAVLSKRANEPVTELGHAVILPGLVNGHSHIAMSVMRGLGEDKSLMAWLQQDIFPREARLTREIQAIGVRLSLAELIRTGCTSIYDMYMRQSVAFEEADKAGIRGVLSENVTRFYPGLNGNTKEDLFDSIREIADKYKGHPRLREGVAPHAPYTTTPELIRECRELANELGIQFGMHLAETKAEEEQCLAEYGLRPVKYIDSLGVLGNDTSLFHCVHVDENDIGILRDRGCVAVHNPASNLKIVSGYSPISKLLEAGVPVSLGTDGPASNNAQDIFRDLWLAAILGKSVAGDPTALTARSALDMATIHGAAAIHDPEIGSLAPGKKADFIALDVRTPNMNPVNDIVANVVYATTGFENRLTVVDGRELYRDGEFFTIDYDDLIGRMDEVRAWVLSQA